VSYIRFTEIFQNEKLLLIYGFIVDPNPYNHVSIYDPLSREDPIHPLKTKLLQQCYPRINPDEPHMDYFQLLQRSKICLGDGYGESTGKWLTLRLLVCWSRWALWILLPFGSWDSLCCRKRCDKSHTLGQCINAQNVTNEIPATITTQVSTNNDDLALTNVDLESIIGADTRTKVTTLAFAPHDIVFNSRESSCVIMVSPKTMQKYQHDECTFVGFLKVPPRLDPSASSSNNRL
jgi:hypothetical protein